MHAHDCVHRAVGLAGGAGARTGVSAERERLAEQRDVALRRMLPGGGVAHLPDEMVEQQCAVGVKGPVEVIRIAEVRQLARRYDYPSVPRLIEEKDLSALVAIYHKLIELQDEEDVEMLLMAAAI